MNLWVDLALKKWPVLMGKWRKNIKKCKMAKNHFSRSDFGSWGGFLGVLGASLYWKVVSEFWFGHPKCHFWYTQNGQNGPFLPFWEYHKWHFGCPNQNSKTTFRDPNHPQNPHLDTLGTFFGPQKVIFGHFAFFWYFCVIFPLARTIFSGPNLLINSWSIFFFKLWSHSIPKNTTKNASG